MQMIVCWQGSDVHDMDVLAAARGGRGRPILGNRAGASWCMKVLYALFLKPHEIFEVTQTKRLSLPIRRDTMNEAIEWLSLSYVIPNKD